MDAVTVTDLVVDRGKRRVLPGLSFAVPSGQVTGLLGPSGSVLLRVWDGPMQPAALALVRSAVTNDWSARWLREFLVTQVLRRVVGTLDVPPREREIRGSLVASQLIGLVIGRYVLQIEPLASASPDWLVETVGPTVQRYLTGEVELPLR